MGIRYFDNNATTKMDEQVLADMLPFLSNSYGNASSIQHSLGRQANQSIDKARQQVADFLKVKSTEIFFTSGATEAINMVLKGIAETYKSKGDHFITCSTEHKAVLSTFHSLEKKGNKVSYLRVNRLGEIDLQNLRQSITDQTVLVAIMAANNETGVIHPIKEIAAICAQKNVLFFCDATQWIGKLPLDLAELPIDILCMSAHKIHGPKGIGALFIRRKSRPIQVPALITGGNQEKGLRGGTYPVAQIVGLASAISQINFNSKLSSIRDYFENKILAEIEEIEIITRETARIPNTSNVHFKHVKGSELMTKLPDICLSSGSACVSGDRDPSHVLKAMGMKDEEAFCSLRFSFSKYNTPLEIDEAVEMIKREVKKIRDNSPIWEMYREGLI